MSFVLPQFKCPPSDPNIVLLRPSQHQYAFQNFHNPSSSLKPSREFVSFRTHSVLSTTTTTLNEREEFHTDSLRNFSYSGAVDYRAKMSFEASLAAETLQKNEESLIEEAAADAIALAKAAAEMAKDAAQLVAQNPSLKHGNLDVSSESDILQKEMLRLIKMDFPVSPKSSGTAKTTAEEELLNQPSTVDEEISDSLESDFDLLESHHLKAEAVRSGRQTERRSRRACAAEKAATAGILVKSGPSSRKKRASVQEVDYSDPLRYLRGTTSSSKLLSVSEEVELSAAIQDLLKLEKLHGELEQRYGKEPTFTQWAAAAGVDQRTLRKRLNHGVICKDRMIKSNIRLVISIAKNYQGSGMNIQDLVQEGCRGLVKGAEKFDASKGFKFSTYAHWWIKQAVRKSLSDQSRTIRLPFHMVEATYRVKEARKKLYSKNGKYPNNEELADVTGLSMKRLAAVMLAPKPPISLDQKIGINQDMKPSDVIANPDAETSESLLMKQFMKHDLNKVLDTLNPRERQVVRWRFGLEDGRMKTLQEIGESMGVSRERVRQIESCAFRKLKNKKRTKCLQQYLLS